MVAAFLLFLGGALAGAEDLPGPYRFACDLMEKGHWEQAIEELRRFCFFYPQDPLVPRASFAMGLCYEQGGRYAEAIETYRQVAARYPDDPVGREALYRVGEASYRAENFQEARIAMERFVAQRPEDPWIWQARYRSAWASLRAHAFVVARDEFSALAVGDHPYRLPAQQMSAGIEEIKELPYRSPALAGLLSGLLPGSGHLYAGAFKDGVLALLVNGALIAGSVEAWTREVYGVAGIVSVAALTFYVGNIYGAINSAHLANQERLEGHLGYYADSYEWWAPD
jgi:tetratricopeptide (TPR) repeat protein